MGARHRPSAPGLIDHIGQREARQVLAHVIAHVGPHSEQDALALVVTGPVLVRFAKVSGRDRSVDGGDDLGERDLLGRSSEDVAAAHAALGANESDALQTQKDLLKVGLGETGTFREVAHGRGRTMVVTQGQTQQCAAGVVPTSRYSHGAILSTSCGPPRVRARGGVILWHTAVVTDRRKDNVTVNPDQVLSPGETEEHAEEANTDYISQPAKVMRIGSMVKLLLDEARSAPLDEAGRTRLREIYETSVHELSDALSPDLAKELSRMAIPFSAGVPSESELRVAQAQLVGWLEGLFHGIQASLFAQQAAAAAQLEKMRDRSLPPGASEPRAGTYL